MTRYNYTCVSKSGALLRGIYIDELQRDSEVISRLVMHEIAQVVHETGMPWDPFNIELIVKKVRAQSEPKPYKSL